MKKTNYILTDCTDPYKNLALEEYLTFREAEDEVTMYLWQNAHTVVIGRNQNPWRECRVEQIKEDGCRLARRISGGGAVYHDLGNLNFTFSAREPRYDVDRQTQVILRAVQMLGIQAERTGRNDLTIDGMKFSGHAYYKSEGYCYHHGTIMLDVDSSMMAKYLNVSAAKLKSKGVRSVRSRVTNLIDHRPGLTVEDLKEVLIRAFGEVYGEAGFEAPVEQPIPSEADPELEALIRKYSSEEWRYGRRIPFDVEFDERLDFGNANVQLHIDGGRIEDAEIYSDALMTEIFKRLADALTGVRYDAEALRSLDLAGIARDDEERKIAAAIIDLTVSKME